MEEEKNKNKSKNIFMIKKVKRNKSLDTKGIDKNQSCKFVLLKKKKVLNKKLSINEILKCGYKVGRWENDEHEKFIKSCMIQLDVVTRTPAQIRSHAQKYVIKLCKKYRIKMKNQRDSLGEDNNFKIGIMPNSRVKRNASNEEDLSFLLCFDYYRNNLIIEDGQSDNLGPFIESDENQGNLDYKVSDRRGIQSSKNPNHVRSKIKLIKKQIFENPLSNDSTLNKKEFFIINKNFEDNCSSDCHKELINIVNDNQQFLDIYTNDEDFEKNIKNIFEFLNNKAQNQESKNVMSMFDLQNFIRNMENTLMMWSMLETDDIN